MEDLVAKEYIHGKLTAIVRYWICYTKNGKQEVLCFGLGDNVAVNSLVGIPTIKAWKCLLNFDKGALNVRGLNTQFPLIYESTKHDFPPGIIFSPYDFIRPLQGSMQSVNSLLTNLNSSNPSTPDANKKVDDKKNCIVTETTYDNCIHCDVNVSNIE